MRWVVGGPDLPPELLQAVEDGNVVFFCGAGVSFPAGLPGFKHLIELVYRRINTSPNKTEQEELESANYDRVLGLLERRVIPPIVRQAVIKELFLDEASNVATHQALVALATSSKGVCRLVTTNFDRGFELAAHETGIRIDSAPRLPIPKVGTWSSIVHLHGRICESDQNGRDLVLASADFGAAYLTEQWASRFLTELFARFQVVFVGYSIEDPVVRYMMDAFAADRARGEAVRSAYVLAGFDTDAQAWEAKGVTPVLYDTADNHSALHKSLAVWANHHKHGLLGRENVVRTHAQKDPSLPKHDLSVGQLLWAIREESGHIAKVFANMEPVPPVHWLKVFSEHGLLSLPPIKPLNSEHARNVPLLTAGGFTENLHPVTCALGDWITRHLGAPEVLDWILTQGQTLHPEFRLAIERRLSKLCVWPRGLQTFWEIFMVDATFISAGSCDPFYAADLTRKIEAGTWTLLEKQQVVEALSPVYKFSRSFMRLDVPRCGSPLSHFVRIEIQPRYRESARDLVDGLRQSSSNSPLIDLADDATNQLKRGMELLELAELSGRRHDPSFHNQPSISSHAQNSLYRPEWTILIEVCRDSWSATLNTNRELARQIVERWRGIKYPVFRRLSLYAMSNSDLYSTEESLDYLLEDDGWWIWSTAVYREKFRLLNSIGPKLTSTQVDKLVGCILTGVPHGMFHQEIAHQEVVELSERSMWLHLAKLHSFGCTLSENGAEKLKSLSDRYTNLKLRDDDRDEFTVWSGSGLSAPPIPNPDEFSELSDHQVIERLIATESLSYEDSCKWRKLVSQRPDRVLTILAGMAETEAWRIEVWHTALESLLHTKETALGNLPKLKSSLLRLKADMLRDILPLLCSSLKLVAGGWSSGDDPEFFWQIWDLIRPIAFENDPQKVGDDPIFEALNSPPGHLTQAILDYLVSVKPADAGEVLDGIWNRLGKLTSGDGRPYQLARVILSVSLPWLFSLNPEWTEKHLLPYFSWRTSSEAPSVWRGYLVQPYIPPPELWIHLKPHLLDALREKAKLGSADVQVCHLFAAVAIERQDWLAFEETQAALQGLDHKGLTAVTEVICRKLEGNDQSDKLWSNLIAPWLEKVWPRDHKLRSPGSSFNLALACTYAGDAFGSAADLLVPFLVPVPYPGRIIDRLLDLAIEKNYPAQVLRLLSAIIDTSGEWPSRKLSDLLDRIQISNKESNQDFRALDEYLRKKGARS